MSEIYNQSQLMSRSWESPFGTGQARRRRIDLRGTIYHRMEEAGVFAMNPANVGAQNEDGTNAYKGPIQYPKMLYHPQGELRITNPGQKVKDVDGSVMLIGQQTELVHRVVANVREERKLLAEGWLDSPARSFAQGVHLGKYEMEIPVSTTDERVTSLEAEIARLTAELAGAQKAQTQAEDELAENELADLAKPLKITRGKIPASSGDPAV